MEEKNEINTEKEEKATKKFNFKALLKKWWFWVIVILLIGAIGAASGSGGSDDGDGEGGSEGNSESSGSETQKDEWYKAGTYKVGKDIPAGEYLVKCASYSCYIQTASNSSGSIDSIIANDNISTHTYITVRDGEYFTVTGGKFILSSKAAAITPDKNGVYGEGTHKVGKDLPAGEYKIKATNSCYIEVASNSDQTFHSIVSNDNIAVGTSTYITVSEGQYLTVKGGEIYAD